MYLADDLCHVVIRGGVRGRESQGDNSADGGTTLQASWLALISHQWQAATGLHQWRHISRFNEETGQNIAQACLKTNSLW